jgi:hypothetical protein
MPRPSASSRIADEITPLVPPRPQRFQLSLLTLVVARFSLISRCTHRAHAMSTFTKLKSGAGAFRSGENASTSRTPSSGGVTPKNGRLKWSAQSVAAFKSDAPGLLSSPRAFSDLRIASRRSCSGWQSRSTIEVHSSHIVHRTRLTH